MLVSPTTARQEQPSGLKRVVLVDDAVDLRLLLRIALERSGRCQVVGEAGDGLDAIAVTAATVPDVIVLDEMMPVMSGIEALPQLRTHAPSARILLFSAVAERLTGACGPGGADGWLAKGADLSSIVEAVVRDRC